MSWYESQIEERARNDERITKRAYTKLASSVVSLKQAPGMSFGESERVDEATKACLHYYGVEPGKVPEKVEDPYTRVEFLCRPSGTMHRKIDLEAGWQHEIMGPLLGCLDSGEFVALLPYPNGGYYYVEPGATSKVRVNDKVASHIKDSAELFYRPLPTRDLTIRDLIVFVFALLSRGDYLLILFGTLAVTLVGFLPPWAYNVAFGTVAPSQDSSLIAPIFALLMGVAVSSALIGMFRNLVMNRVSLKVTAAVEAATFGRLLALPTSFFKEYASGDIAMRISYINEIAKQMLATLLTSLLSAVFSLLYLASIFMFAPSLTVPAILIIVIQGVLMVMVTLTEIRWKRKSMEANAKLSGEVTSLLGGIQKLKLAGAEQRAFGRWADFYSNYAVAVYNRPLLVKTLPALVSLTSLLGTVVIYFVAGTTHVSMADFMSFNVAYGQVSAAITILAQIAEQLAQIGPMLEMVEPILKEKPETSDDRPPVSSLDGDIGMSGVSFRYLDKGPYVLNNVSLHIRPGEYVALVGKSGCGKSTILRLLLGFEKPESGSIFYGSYDTSKVDLRSLRQGIGMVMQDGRLFMGDIAANITIATPWATLDDAWEAAELAGIADDIRKMPMGMQTLVSEGGGGISGGQRQRIMIARAICGKKRILMFDEATSALDNKTQKHVSDSLDSLNCTRLVVAHRLSTVRHCDRILVMDEGRIAEEGTYEELIARNGIFADLVARQRLDQEA